MTRLAPLCLLCIAFAAPVLGQSEPQDLIAAFAERLHTEGPHVAVDSLFSTNEWMMRSQDTRDQITTQLTNLLPLIGAYHGREQIATRQAGGSLVLYSYLFKYDRQPVRFNFMFYRPEEEWRLYRFTFDDSFDVELEEANKLYYLDPDGY
jgi:hypothetical protein